MFTAKKLVAVVERDAPERVRICFRIRNGMLNQYYVAATVKDFRWPKTTGQIVKAIDGDENDYTMQEDRKLHPDAELTTDLISFVKAVKGAVDSKAGSIGFLYVSGHGAPGVQLVGGGRHTKLSQMISVDRWGKLRQTKLLGQLTPLFAKDAVVRLDGCNVAESWRGKVLLWELAELWNVRVQGGTITQLVDKHSMTEGNQLMEAVPDSLWHRVAGPNATPKRAVKVPSPLPGWDGSSNSRI
jgi:hypothetical protein